MEQHSRELDSWDELVEKAIEVEAKVSRQPPSNIREMDQRCPRGNHSVHTTVAKSPAQVGTLETSPPRLSKRQRLKITKSSHRNSSRSETAGETSDRERKEQRRQEQGRNSGHQCQFNSQMDTKSLSSRQVRWAQELSRYPFRMAYCQGKANRAADVLSRFPQRSQSNNPP